MSWDNFTLDRTLVNIAPLSVSSPDVLDALRDGPIEITELIRRLNHKDAGERVWRMIDDGELRVSSDFLVSSASNMRTEVLRDSNRR